jgi:6-phosphogluconolactonase
MEQGSSVMAFQLNAKTGALNSFQTVSTLPTDFSEKNSCADLELTRSGNFLYVSNRGHDSIACFAVDAESGR